MQIHRILAASAAVLLTTGAASAQQLSFADIVASQSAALQAEGFTVVEAQRRVFGGAKIEAVGRDGRMEITLNAQGQIVKQEYYGGGAGRLPAADLPAGAAAGIEAALGGAGIGAFEVSRLAGGRVEVEATGTDGEAATKELKALVDRHFDED